MNREYHHGLHVPIMNPDIKPNQDILTEDLKQFESNFGERLGLEQLLCAEPAQVGPFRDGFVDEIIAGTEDDAEAVSLEKDKDEEDGQRCSESSDETGDPKKNCHLNSEKRRRSLMRDTFAYLGELVSDGAPRKRSRAEILSSASNYILDMNRQTREIENSVKVLRFEVARMHQA